jgi:hypothetical protein
LGGHKETLEQWGSWLKDLDPGKRGSEWFAEDEAKVLQCEQRTKSLEKEEWKVQNEGWKAWKELALQGSVSAGHRFAKVGQL